MWACQTDWPAASPQLAPTLNPSGLKRDSSIERNSRVRVKQSEYSSGSRSQMVTTCRRGRIRAWPGETGKESNTAMAWVFCARISRFGSQKMQRSIPLDPSLAVSVDGPAHVTDAHAGLAVLEREEEARTDAAAARRTRCGA